MADALNEVLGLDVVQGTVEKIKPGIPRALPDAFYAPTTQTDSDVYQVDEVDGQRRMGRVTPRGNPSQQAKGLEMPGAAAYTCLPFKEHTLIKPDQLERLRQMGGTNPDTMGERLVAHKLGQLTKRQEINRIGAAEMMLLGGGKIYADNDGKVLSSASGATITVDASIPASNLTQATDLDGSTIIDASWATASTDIHAHMKTLINTAVRRCGYPLVNCVYGDNIMGYLLGNTAVQNLLQSNGQLAQAQTNNELPSRLLGIQNWIPATNSFWVDEDGTVRDLVGANEIVLMPAPGTGWYEMVEAVSYTPNQGNVIGARSVSAMFNRVYGKYSYATLEDDPVGAKLIVGDNFLPIITVPNAIYKLDVTP